LYSASLDERAASLFYTLRLLPLHVKKVEGARHLLADEAFQGRDPGLVLLEQVGGLNFVVESASLVLLNYTRIRFR
jgi:hypothetical protein